MEDARQGRKKSIQAQKKADLKMPQETVGTKKKRPLPEASGAGAMAAMMEASLEQQPLTFETLGVREIEAQQSGDMPQQQAAEEGSSTGLVEHMDLAGCRSPPSTRRHRRGGQRRHRSGRAVEACWLPLPCPRV
ncbi:UNVERIFIED_CONTAM: hypothetical protein K2H54_034015 [Gekko kuhli]